MGNSVSKSASEMERYALKLEEQKRHGLLKIKVKDQSVVAHLDTCVKFCYVQPQLIEQLQLITLPTQTRDVSPHGPVTTFTRKCNVALTCRGSAHVLVECMVLDQDTPDRPLVTLGQSFFERFYRFQFTYKEGIPGKSITLTPETNSAGLQMPMQFREEVMSNVNISTGSQVSSIAPDFARRMELQVQPLSSPVTVHFANGGSAVASLCCYTHVNINNDAPKMCVFLVLEEQAVDMIVGRDFLTQYKHLIIQYYGRLPPFTLEE